MTRYPACNVHLGLGYRRGDLNRAPIRATAICVSLALLTGCATAGFSQGSNAQSAGANSGSPSSGVRGGPLRHGLLYVLDPNDMKPESHVLVVDPTEGRIVRTFSAGFQPDMALSPDGTRLYLASTSAPADGRSQGYLDVIDTATGSVIRRVANPDLRGFNTPQYPSQMAISPSGRWLHFFKARSGNSPDTSYIATFDTLRGEFVPGKAPVPGCEGALLALPKDRQLAVLCHLVRDSHPTVRVLLVDIIDRGTFAFSSVLPVEPAKEQERAIVLPMPSSDGRALRLITGAGGVYEASTESRRATAENYCTMIQDLNSLGGLHWFIGKRGGGS
jgi:hypothetical protein